MDDSSDESSEESISGEESDASEESKKRERIKHYKDDIKLIGRRRVLKINTFNKNQIDLYSIRFKGKSKVQYKLIKPGVILFPISLSSITQYKSSLTLLNHVYLTTLDLTKRNTTLYISELSSTFTLKSKQDHTIFKVLHPHH